jgi:hypothetical protein
MPVGANDFSRDWYSYDETPDDFALERFSIANDLETLAPFLKNAQGYNPALRLSGSERTVSVTAGTKRSRISMDADSINTLLLSRDA